MNIPKAQLISWYFTVATAIGRCTPDAETRFISLIPSMTPKERAGIAYGFKQGISDLLEKSEYWAPEDDEKVDALLVAKGLPKLNEMREALRGKLARLLRRGVIMTEEDADIAIQTLSNLQTPLTKRQRAKIGNMVVEYEQKPKIA